MDSGDASCYISKPPKRQKATKKCLQQNMKPAKEQSSGKSEASSASLDNGPVALPSKQNGKLLTRKDLDSIAEKLEFPENRVIVSKLISAMEDRDNLKKSMKEAKEHMKADREFCTKHLKGNISKIQKSFEALKTKEDELYQSCAAQRKVKAEFIQITETKYLNPIPKQARATQTEPPPKRYKRKPQCKWGHHRCMYAHKRIQIEIASPVYLHPSMRNSKWEPIFTTKNYGHIHELQIFRFYSNKRHPNETAEYQRPIKDSNSLYLNMKRLQYSVYRIHGNYESTSQPNEDVGCPKCEMKRSVLNKSKRGLSAPMAQKPGPVIKKKKTASTSPDLFHADNRWKNELKSYDDAPPLDWLAKYRWCLYLANYCKDAKAATLHTRIFTINNK